MHLHKRKGSCIVWEVAAAGCSFPSERASEQSMGQVTNASTPSLIKMRFREVWQYATQPSETMSANPAIPTKMLQHIEESIQEKLAAGHSEIEACLDRGFHSMGIYEALDRQRDLGVEGALEVGDSAAALTEARIQVLKEKRDALKTMALQTGEHSRQLHAELSTRRCELNNSLNDLSSKLSGFRDGMDLEN